ncbi:MAG: radical SAM protein [Lachnospiraceae bacterium]|nr:radical SAM protein [Lachnospiraceae bacterium]
MVIADYVGILHHENRVVAVNRRTGCWMKFSESCYRILMRAIELGYTEEKLLPMLADDEDREYMSELIRQLRNAGIVVDANMDVTGSFSDISLMMTKRCNLHCRHCSVSADTMHEKECFDTDEMKKIIDKIIECSPKKIVLTGGEPLARSDFSELLEYLSSRFDGAISVMTNGTLINEQMASLLSQKLSSIDLSMDGVDEDTCSVIRGKGVFAQVINAIKLLQEHGLSDISLSMVSTPQNALFEDAFLELCSSLKVAPVLRKFDVLGRAKNNMDILGKVEERYSDRKRREVKPVPVENEIGCTCQGGYDSLFIRYDGMVFPCPMLEKEDYSICNIADVPSLRAYFQSVDYSTHPAYIALSKIDPMKAEECRDCPVSLFCWSCPYYLLLAQRNPDYFKQHCLPQKLSLMERIWG